jgi:hypothetical protein
MNVTLHIPDGIAEVLTEAGADAERLALAALKQAADTFERGKTSTGSENARRAPAEAAARMRESRVGNVLPDGVTIRDLMAHGRA